MTRTPMSTITRPTTRIAYRATAVTVPLNRLPSGSPASAPGASPDASCHGPVGAPPLSFFFERGSALTDASLAVLTTDHPPAAVLDVARAAGTTGCAGGIGSAGRGAGVHDGSLGAGLGVGSGAGRNGSGGATG